MFGGLLHTAKHTVSMYVFYMYIYLYPPGLIANAHNTHINIIHHHHQSFPSLSYPSFVCYSCDAPNPIVGMRLSYMLRKLLYSYKEKYKLVCISHLHERARISLYINVCECVLSECERRNIYRLGCDDGHL